MFGVTLSAAIDEWTNARLAAGETSLAEAIRFHQANHRDIPATRTIEQVTEDHALGILMHLAAKGEWRNPPLGAPDYYRVSKSFLRLRKLLKGLVSLPGEPFRKHRGAFVPVF